MYFIQIKYPVISLMFHSLFAIFSVYSVSNCSLHGYEEIFNEFTTIAIIKITFSIIVIAVVMINTEVSMVILTIISFVVIAQFVVVRSLFLGC